MLRMIPPPLWQLAVTARQHPTRHVHDQCKGNANAILPITTVVGVPPFHSGGTHAERSSSGAVNSRSEVRAEAIGGRLQTLVRLGMTLYRRVTYRHSHRLRRLSASFFSMPGGSW